MEPEMANEVSTNDTAPVANLRETRKQMAASRKAHPAGKQAPAKAPATAPAKSEMRMQAGTGTAAAKISWKPEGEKNDKGEYDRSVGTCGDKTYSITRQADGSFKATVMVGKGALKTLAENAKSGNAAWQKCVADAKNAVAA
jgi:hypothetical protein